MARNKDKSALIRELRALGRLIDPAPSGGDLTDKPPPPGFEVPILTEIVESPTPTTFDMFESPAVTTQAADNADRVPPLRSDNQAPTTFRADTATPIPPLQSPAPADTAIDELTHELLRLIEKRLHRHTGESLDEALRDQLSRDIRGQLVPWLKGD